MFMGKARSLPESGASERCLTWGGFGLFPTNIRLGWKGLLRTNTLAYYKQTHITIVKSFITLAQVVQLRLLQLYYRRRVWVKIWWYSQKHFKFILRYLASLGSANLSLFVTFKNFANFYDRQVISYNVSSTPFKGCCFTKLLTIILRSSSRIILNGLIFMTIIFVRQWHRYKKAGVFVWC
jgi:hypothetical protein